MTLDQLREATAAILVVAEQLGCDISYTATAGRPTIDLDLPVFRRVFAGRDVTATKELCFGAITYSVVIDGVTVQCREYLRATPERVEPVTVRLPAVEGAS